MAQTQAQVERLLPTRKVSDILGINENDVRHLIRVGKLAAKHQVCRGKRGRPRLFVLQSELDRYIAALADARGHIARPHQRTAAKPHARRSTSSGVIEFV